MDTSDDLARSSGSARSDVTPGRGEGKQTGIGAPPDISAGDRAQPGPGVVPAQGTAGHGYGQPGPGGKYPVPRSRSRWRIWLGIAAGFCVLAIVIAGISAYILHKSKKWTLTAPPTVAGMPRSASPADQREFSALVAKFKSDVTHLPNYGSLTSTVSGLYTHGPDQTVGLIGFNGTFNVRVALKTGPGLTVSGANPGPHGGTAECGSDSANAICQWSTATTIGIVVVIPTSTQAGQESLKSANTLMVKMRDSAERPAAGS